MRSLIIVSHHAKLLAMNDYTSFAELYDLFYDDFQEDLEMYRGFAERASGPILEIGSGTGRVALALAEAGHAVVGVNCRTRCAPWRSKGRSGAATERVEFVAGTCAASRSIGASA
jgi:SAM-dependent methyltransferase